MYKSEISNAKWMAYALLANVGWISFLIALSLCFITMPEIFKNRAIVMLLLMNLLSAALMICGILELIGEHAQKLNRVLSGKCLARGFGALTIGGALGALFSLLAFVIALWSGLRGASYLIILCGGSLLCGLCSGLVMKEYREF
jgi:hypothetical protein